MGYLTWGQTADLVLAAVTCLFCVVIALGMVNWLWRLWNVPTLLRPLIFSTGVFKAALAGWAWGNCQAILFEQNFPPQTTLFWRIMILVAAIIQALVVWRMAQPALSEKVVLVVEDERAYARALRRMLESAGFSVDWVSRGDEALVRIRGRKYSLVIMDIILPDLSGLEVVRRARAAGSRVPMLAMSGAMEAMDKQLLRDAGFHEVYLAKPFTVSELNDILSRLGFRSATRDSSPP